jgi:HEAT repeat protein
MRIKMLKTYKILGFFALSLAVGSYALWRSTLPDDMQLYWQNKIPQLYGLNGHTTAALKTLPKDQQTADFYLQQKKSAVRSHPESNAVEGSGLAQSIPEFLNEEDRLNWARKIISTGTSVQKLCAIQAIFDHDPSEAAKHLIELMQTAKISDADTEFLVQGILFLENQKSVLLDSDLTYFYEKGNAELQKTVAKILADRGDPALLNNYLAQTSPLLQSEDPQVRLNILRVMGSLNSSAVVPFAVAALNDADPQVKIDALEIVATLGSQANSTSIQKLLTDTNPRVQLQAQRVLNNILREITTMNPISANTEQVAALPDHGFPAIAGTTNEFPAEILEPTNE